MPKPKTSQFSCWGPEAMHLEMKKAAYQYLYTTHEWYKPIYEIIKQNPTVSLGKLQYQLRTQGITPSIAGMKNVATWCDLSYTE